MENNTVIFKIDLEDIYVVAKVSVENAEKMWELFKKIKEIYETPQT